MGGSGTFREFFILLITVWPDQKTWEEAKPTNTSKWA
jgi:hypothetical protein